MGVVTVSSSASGALVGFNSKFSTSKSVLKRPSIVAFRADNKNSSMALLTRPDQTNSPVETSKKHKKKSGNRGKSSRKAVLTDEVSPSTLELDYNDAAAKLESIFKLNSTPQTSDVEDATGGKRKTRRRRKKATEDADCEIGQAVVRSRRTKEKRLTLDRRIVLKHSKDEEAVASVLKKKDVRTEDDDRLVRDYSASTNLISLDWKKMKIPPVLPSTEHAWLFKLMQPMKALFEVNEDLRTGLGREPAEAEFANAVKMTVAQVRRHLEVGHAARNKLIKHNLRLVLFVINKYFQGFVNGPRFQDLCQAGVKGLITAIDRFEPNRKLRLSTYSLFWIRHAIIRSMTVSSFTRVSFGLESVFTSSPLKILII